MSETLLEGLTLLCMGMGFVLSFLCVMIVSMTIMSRIVKYLNQIFPEVVETTERKSVAADDCAAIALAIVAAKFRK